MEDMHSQKVVIGIDGGGTSTRLAIVRTDGKVLAYVESGSSNIRKDTDAKKNVQKAILEALEVASCQLQDVIGIAAGIAGLDSNDDHVWADALTEIEGLTCPRWTVNDAMIAHAASFLMKPGIVVISGTGSIIFGKNEEGQTFMISYNMLLALHAFLPTKQSLKY